jgi:hypothetical protein
MATPPPPAGPTIQPPNQPPSQAEVEYRELRGFLESLVEWSAVAISTIVVVAGFLLYNSLSDAKKDAETQSSPHVKPQTARLAKSEQLRKQPLGQRHRRQSTPLSRGRTFSA